jgi:hypothetical protein
MATGGAARDHGIPDKWVGVGFIHDLTPSLFKEAIPSLSELVDREASVEAIPSRSEEEAGVVLVFQVPGRITPPIEFTGMRTSSYFRDHHSKQMQVAVPADLSSTDELEAFLAWAFEEAPVAALKALRRQRVPASMDCATEAATRIVAQLGDVVAEASRRYNAAR